MIEESKEIRIAQIIGKMQAGGVESVVFNYYRFINKKNIQFDFYYDSDSIVKPPQDLIDMGARFYKLPPYQKVWRYIPELQRYFKNEKYNIIHSHINSLSVVPLMVAFLNNIPVRVAHNHSVPGKGDYKRNIFKYFFKVFSKLFSTHYFACSEKAGRWLFGNKAYDNNKVSIIYNAIDIERFNKYKYNKMDIKKELRIVDSFVIGHVGRFTYAKNHDFLIDIFEKIKIKKENAVLLLVGDGELFDKIKSKVEEKKMQDCVLFIGKTDCPEKYYKIMDVVILPSIFEGLSLTTIESQFSNVPILVSESVPDEAIISTSGVKKMSLNDTSEQWADESLNLSNSSVLLSDKSKLYDISKAVKHIENFYMDKLIP